MGGEIAGKGAKKEEKEKKREGEKKEKKEKERRKEKKRREKRGKKEKKRIQTKMLEIFLGLQILILVPFGLQA